MHDNKSKDMLYQRLANYGLTNKPFTITMKDLIECIRKQKQRKAIGPDGMATESIIHADSRLLVHLSIMFNLFLEARYVPPAFIQSTIIPLVKLKSGELSYVNNYQAIAISTSLSKLFESVLVNLVTSSADCERYQFGFKARHSTGICTKIFKQTVDYYVNRGSNAFLQFYRF